MLHGAHTAQQFYIYVEPRKSLYLGTNRKDAGCRLTRSRTSGSGRADCHRERFRPCTARYTAVPRPGAARAGTAGPQLQSSTPTTADATRAGRRADTHDIARNAVVALELR